MFSDVTAPTVQPGRQNTELNPHCSYTYICVLQILVLRPSHKIDSWFLCVFNCLHLCQPDYEQARLCAYVSIFACLHLGVCLCVCVGLKLAMASLCAIMCNTVLVLIIISPWACSGVQSPTRGAFGSVGEVLEAAWPCCAPSFPLRRVPGTACTTGKPSLTTRLPAQPTPCLNRAGGCHVMPNTHMQEGLLASANTRTHIFTGPTPGGFDTCSEDAAEVRANVWSLI